MTHFISDGATGTMLRCLDPNIDLTVYDRHRLDLLGKIHRAYIDAGANFITTDTIAAPLCYWHDLIDAARTAADGKASLMLSMHESGDFPLTEHIEKVDILLLESIIDAKAALKKIERLAKAYDKPIFASFASTNDTAAIAEICKIEKVNTIGLNCIDIGEIHKGLKKIRELTTKPMFAQPSVTTDITPHQFAYAMKILQKRYRLILIGGCCGTTPEMIRLLTE